mmetsp:Transcript_26241/g.43954  ORF Transcript_26241/g.43954 Transcript_26241/m.43954 type:complete len:265 (-) Transcript_26241:700-1494(-)
MMSARPLGSNFRSRCLTSSRILPLLFFMTSHVSAKITARSTLSRFFGSRPVTSFERRMGPRNRYFRRFSSAENAGNSRKYKFAPSTTILSSPRHSIGLFRGKRLVHAKGFGAADDDQDEHSRNVRTMTTGELRAEIESFGLGSEDCEDRLDLERKLKAVRRGTYKEGKIKTAEDAGGYLKSQRTSSSGPAIEDISGISSQENKAAAFDQALQQTSVQSQQAQAESFDAAIQDRLDYILFLFYVRYPCEHEIKIVGAKASEIGDP